MSPSPLRFAAILLASLFAARSANAITYFVPEDREMIQRSDDIVVVTALGSSVERNARGGIVTRFTLRIEEVLKGPRKSGSHLALYEFGGELDGIWTYSPGTPSYEPGRRYLIFTETDDAGEPITYGASLGRFELLTEDGRTLAVRSDIVGVNRNLDAHREGSREAALFVQYIRQVLAWNDGTPNYYVVPKRSGEPRSDRWDITPNFTRSSYLIDAAFGGRRRVRPSYTMTMSGSQPGADAPLAFATAVTLWNGTDSEIDIDDDRDDTETCSLCDSQFDTKNVIQFNRPISTSNALGTARLIGSNRHYVDGAQFTSISEADVQIDDIFFSQCLLNVVVTHELGHTLGFRHSNQPPAGGASTNNAFMSSHADCSLYGDGQLKPYDEDAAATVYSVGTSVCFAASISTQPKDETISVGENTTLSVVAGGTGPFTYEWFIVSAIPWIPTGTNSATLTTGPLTTTTSYMVRVTAQCGTLDVSRTATVKVTCAPPNITNHPQSKSITTGSTTGLTVTASGMAPLSYQWFIGPSGDTSKPTGTNSSSLSNLSPSTTTSYWVRVTGQCAPAKDSETATITVTCPPPSITDDPENKAITAGSTTSLSVTASGPGPLSYQWFIGTSGDTSRPTGTNSNALNNLSPATTTSYWVRVTGLCGSVNSTTATITVRGFCTIVVIERATATPAGTGLITLSARASGGTGLTYTWFRGNTPGAGGTNIGTGATLSNVRISAPTKYWVRARNDCDNTAVSDLVAAAPCGLPSIATQPVDTTVPANGMATLSIVLVDPNHTTRWYQGAPPSKTVQVGTGDTITIGPIAMTTTFWAAVTNSCGEVASRTVTVGLCIAPSITTQPSSQQIISGESVTLSVVATGTEALSYFWFQGELGDETTPVGTSASSFTVGPLLKTTKFWVRVTNACGSATSLPATITVPPPKRRAVRR